MSEGTEGPALDATQDELALDLSLLHRVLVLAGHFGDTLGDIGVCLIDCDDAVAVQIGLPSQTFEQIVGEDPVPKVLALLADLAGPARRQDHPALALG